MRNLVQDSGYNFELLSASPPFFPCALLLSNTDH